MEKSGGINETKETKENRESPAEIGRLGNSATEWMRNFIEKQCKKFKILHLFYYVFLF